ncbi:hypothetical protein [Erythrobacter oryzae]|uniref:hypothetical protein n=1 Tax=Erythrobacter oryzae TaxID=3019556 RepID=UPI002556642D|nr:hypothetical protein [Erythrobacter sp. COR-2]
MAQDQTSSTGQFTLMAVRRREEEADYSYDQWRHAQMRQMEQSYAAATGGERKPAAA